MEQPGKERSVWVTEATRAARVGAVIAAVITVVGGIPAFIVMIGRDPAIWKILESLGRLAVAFLGYWIFGSILAVIVRLAAKGISRLLGREAAKK